MSDDPPRRRRDPHAERRAEGRKRIDRSGNPATPAVVTGPAQPAPQEIHRIEDPSSLILAMPDLEAGRLSEQDHDLLGAAQQLAGAVGGATLAITFETPRDDLGRAGVDRHIGFRGEAYEGYSPEARVAALAAVARTLAPRHLLFPDAAQGGDLGRRLAARLDEPAAASVWRLSDERATCRADGGGQDLVMPRPRILLLAAAASEPYDGPPREARPLPAPTCQAGPRIRDLGRVAVDPQAIALEETPFILAAGDGLTDWPLFHELASALGATEAGSRVVVDKGHLPRDRQIGASGRHGAARCYLALGISGAPQHLDGIIRCEKVIAINADPACAMLKRADLAVVGDLKEILPRLLRIVKERRRNV